MSTRIAKIINYVHEDIIEREYKIPVELKNDIEKIIKASNNLTIKDKRNIRKLENQIDTGLYFAIAIMYFNFNKMEELALNNVRFNDAYYIHYKWDGINGCQISKEILTNILSTTHCWKIKKLLLDNDIIKMVALNDKKDVYYSKNNKQAIRYIINEKYLNYFNRISIKNRYADKHWFLMKNQCLFGDKRKTLKNNYNPFDNEEKNYQYYLQKQLTFDENEFKSIFLTKYNNLKSIPGIWDRLDKCLEFGCYRSATFNNEVICDYKIFYSVNKHIFKTSESYGRIFMPLHYMSKEFRSALRFKGHKLKEIYDVKCCFVQLAARLFKYQTQYTSDADILLELANNDIYLEIAKTMNITRADAKTNMMQFLFTTAYNRKLTSNKNYMVLNDYFKLYHKNFYNWLIEYPVQTFRQNNKLRHVSKLSYDCFKLESDIMFTHVLPRLKKEYPDIEFLSLHDGIWTTENINVNFKDLINNLINSFKY